MGKHRVAGRYVQILRISRIDFRNHGRHRARAAAQLRQDLRFLISDRRFQGTRIGRFRFDDCRRIVRVARIKSNFSLSARPSMRLSRMANLAPASGLL